MSATFPSKRFMPTFLQRMRICLTGNPNHGVR
jgi:hypothetical protein